MGVWGDEGTLRLRAAIGIGGVEAQDGRLELGCQGPRWLMLTQGFEVQDG